MARSDEPTKDISPSDPDRVGFRHWGDGLAGRIFAARLQGYYPSGPDYRDVQVDANGVVQVAGGTGGGGSGGAVTVADGADVAQGTTTDASSANTVVGLLKAIKAAITGTIAVSGTFWQATQPVSGTFWQATQPVSGPATDTQLRATPLPVSGTVTASGPVTDTQLRASAVPVSLASVPSHAVTTVDGGSVAIGTTTDLSSANTLVGLLKAIKAAVTGTLAVSGTFWQATQPVSGTFWQGTQPVSGPVTDTQLRASAVPVSLASVPAHGVTVADGGDVAQGTTTDLSSANTVVGILKAIKAAVTGTLAVSGTFWQATQPVSGPVTDTQLRASAVPVSLASVPSHAVTTADGGQVTLGTTTDLSSANTVVGVLKAIKAAVTGTLAVSGTFWQATQPVSGTFWQATQPVSLATNTPDVTDRAARLLGHVTVDQGPAASLAVTATAATGVAATATLPAAGAGLFHYITAIEIELYATAARTGAAAPLSITTTNLPGSIAWWMDTAQAIGAVIRKFISFPDELKSSVANTATTIVCPLATTGQWRINVYYRTGT